MKKFFTDLAAAIAAVKLDAKSQGDVDALQEGDHVLGVLPEDLQRFYSVMRREGDEGIRLCNSVHCRIEKLVGTPIAKISPADLKFYHEHMLLHERRDLLSEIFWHGVRTAFPEAINSIGSGMLALRQGWKVVVTPMERRHGIISVSMGAGIEPDSLFDLLASALGRGIGR